MAVHISICYHRGCKQGWSHVLDRRFGQFIPQDRYRAAVCSVRPGGVRGNGTAASHALCQVCGSSGSTGLSVPAASCHRPARLPEPQHHAANRHADNLCDLLVRHVFKLAQNQAFSQLDGQTCQCHAWGDQVLPLCRSASGIGFEFRHLQKNTCAQNAAGQRYCRLRPVATQRGEAGPANDLQQPPTLILAKERWEALQRQHDRSLDDFLSRRPIKRQPVCQVMGSVQMGQDDPLKLSLRGRGLILSIGVRRRFPLQRAGPVGRGSYLIAIGMQRRSVHRLSPYTRCHRAPGCDAMRHRTQWTIYPFWLN